MAKYDELHLLIDGERLGPKGRASREVRSPATGAVIGTLPHASKADLDRALDAAARTFKEWRKVSAYERSKVLKRAADLMRERIDHIATLMTMEQGKTLAEARGEVIGTADTFEWYGEEGKRAYGRLIPSRDGSTSHAVTKEPVGVVAAFAPWNFPAVTAARKIAPALAAGCSVIIKPAEETPATPLALVKALEDAGLPKGVVNVVFGEPSEVSTHLIASPIVRKISFTGSTAVGKHLAKLAADGVKRCTMELGGHAPVIIFDDADLDQAVNLSTMFKFRNAGQVCTNPTRFFVHDAVHDAFVKRFSEAARTLPVGNGLDTNNKMGPVANPRRVDAMQDLIGDAQKHGAKVHTGGERIGNEGYFWKPTIMSDVPVDSKIMNVEPFGPVAAINRFTRFDDVIEEANRLPYGLAGYAFTQSSKTASAVSGALDTGLVGINTFVISLPETPFGGVKESGYGLESGAEGLDAYLATKFVAHA